MKKVFKTAHRDYFGRPIYLTRDGGFMFLDVNMDDANPDLHEVGRKPPINLKDVYWSEEGKYEPLCRAEGIEIIKRKGVEDEGNI
jgi:hypothetical protein